MGNSHKSSVLPLNRGEKNLQDQANDIRKEFLKNINTLNDRISQLEQNYTNNSSDQAADELREELIEGIRLIGKRVTKAVSQMNERFDKFTETIKQTTPTQTPATDVQKDEQQELEDTNFGNIKDGNVKNYELISKTNIAQLAKLFRKQSDSIKKIIEIQQQKFFDYESQLKSINDEAEKTQREFDKKIKQNFLISVGGIGLLLIIIIFILIF